MYMQKTLWSLNSEEALTLRVMQLQGWPSQTLRVDTTLNCALHPSLASPQCQLSLPPHLSTISCLRSRGLTLHENRSDFPFVSRNFPVFFDICWESVCRNRMR